MMRVLRPLIEDMAIHRGWLGLGAALALLATLSGIGLLMISGWLITAAGLAGIAAAGLSAVTFNFFPPSAGIRGLAITRTLGRYGERIVTHEATFRALASLRVRLFRRLIPLAPGRLTETRSGDLLTRLTSDVDQLDSLYLRLLVPSFVALSVAVLIGGFMVIAAPAVGLTVIILMAAAGYAGPALADRLSRADATAQVDGRAELKTALNDYCQGLSELLITGAAEAHRDRMRTINAGLMAGERRLAVIAGLSNGLTSLLSGFAVLGAIVFGLALFESGGLNGPWVAMFVLGTMACFEAVAPLPLAYQLLGRLTRAGARLQELSAQGPAVTEPPPESRVTDPGPATIALENVTLRYRDGQPAALDQVSITVPKGTALGVQGHSGAGKTSLFNLLTKTVAPTSGQITWNGVPFAEIPADDLYERIGYMGQQPRLFAGTLADNLRLAKPDADAAQMLAALEAVGLRDFAETLPHGLETWLGDQGRMVSGGQARRLTLARLLLKDPALILLDEPTEGLDPETEALVLDTMKRLLTGRTLILISHRMAPLSIVEKVVRLDNGRLIAEAVP